MTRDAVPHRSADRVVPLVVNGLETRAHVDAELIEESLLPALNEVATRPHGRRRTFAFLVGPPGAGKSTLATLLADATRHRPGTPSIDVVGIDGFHHPAGYLATHRVATDTGPVPLSSIKGAPETFDVTSLARHLAGSAERDDVVWPTYDRRVHDVVAGTDPVTADLVVVEGNWLLLDEPGWRELSAYADYVIHLAADAELLRERLIERKVRGGLGPAEAAAFYDASDRRNVERFTTSSDFSKVDLTLTVKADGTIEQGDNS